MENEVFYYYICCDKDGHNIRIHFSIISDLLRSNGHFRTEQLNLHSKDIFHEKTNIGVNF